MLKDSLALFSCIPRTLCCLFFLFSGLLWAVDYYAGKCVLGSPVKEEQARPVIPSETLGWLLQLLCVESIQPITLSLLVEVDKFVDLSFAFGLELQIYR